MILGVFIKKIGVKIVITDIYQYFIDIFFRNSNTYADEIKSRNFTNISEIFLIFWSIDYQLVILFRGLPITDISIKKNQNFVLVNN